jgi:CDP-diglyceride synthetase
MGFIMGFLLFLLVSTMLTLTYHDEFWLLFGCIGVCVAVGSATFGPAIRMFERKAKR